MKTSTPTKKLTRFAGAIAALSMAAAASAGARLGWLDIEGAPLERPSPFSWLSGEEAQPTLRGLVLTIEDAAERDDIDGLVLRLRGAALTRTQIEELGQAIKKVQNSGKKVHLFTEIFGPAELLLGALADDVIAQAGGAVSLPGLHAEEMYFADTLAWLGVKADFVQIGDYKGAAETMVNSGPSKAWDQNISQLLDSIYNQMRDDLKEGRHLTNSQLDNAMENAWFVSPAEAIKLGLVDAEIDRLDLDEYLEEQYGDFEYDTDFGVTADASPIDLANPFAMLQLLTEQPEQRIKRSTIAVLHIDGAIIDGESTEKGLFGGSSNVGSLTIRAELKKIEDEDKIKGLIVRIDSPGGSAIASESIWLGVRRVAEKKPVWISVGSMAASGGYYIAVAGDRIYVNPASIVGSIGVVGGKYALGGLYEKLKINVVPRSRGPRADLFDSTEAWDATERKLIEIRMTETYDQFVGRVTAGRKGIDVSRTAEGRLFTGERAIKLNMADNIGGLETAINDFAKELRLREGRYDVIRYPGQKSISELMDQMFGGMVASPALPDGHSALLSEAGKAIRMLVGDAAWPSVRSSIEAMAQIRTEPVLLVSPSILILK